MSSKQVKTSKFLNKFRKPDQKLFTNDDKDDKLFKSPFLPSDKNKFGTIL